MGPQDDLQRAQDAIAIGDWKEVVSLGPVAVEPLIAALGEEDETVSAAAAKALGNLADARAVDPLIEALLLDLHAPGRSSESLRVRAAMALGKLKAEQAIGPLITALSAPSGNVRAAAVDALGQIGDAAAEPLIALVGSGDEKAAVVVKVLAKLGEAAVEPLLAAIGSDEGPVGFRLSRVLAELRPSPQHVVGIMVASEDASVRVHAADWLVECLAKAEPSDPEVADAFAELRNRPGAVEPILATLRADRPASRQAPAALARIGGPLVAEGLVDWLDKLTREDARVTVMGSRTGPELARRTQEVEICDVVIALGEVAGKHTRAALTHALPLFESFARNPKAFDLFDAYATSDDAQDEVVRERLESGARAAVQKVLTCIRGNAPPVPHKE